MNSVWTRWLPYLGVFLLGWGLLQLLDPVSDYGVGGMVYSCGVFVLAQSLIRSGGSARGCRQAAHGPLGRRLGDATLGVYAVHLTVVALMLKTPWIGGAPASPSGFEMLARVAVTLLVTYPLVLLLRRLPYVRALL